MEIEELRDQQRIAENCSEAFYTPTICRCLSRKWLSSDDQGLSLEREDPDLNRSQERWHAVVKIEIKIEIEKYRIEAGCYHSIPF